MQNEPDSTAQQREASFAKLLEYEQRQVLVYLYRNEDDDLAIVFQMWVALTDEQIRADITAKTDELAMKIFENLDQSNVGEIVRQLGIPEIIQDMM